VKELFGIEQARLAMDDWMEEVEAMDCPSGEAAPMWRRITIAAAARLASRVSKRAWGKPIPEEQIRSGTDFRHRELRSLRVFFARKQFP
jgi:hypothetical protein